ncbi:hypothetical protein [Yoonia sediminilitoris]|uniref:Uncharacterized protein n=1 Tax=Yoonia sediminilitoris TaxID=1286148 RepID=A0A2T6K604_9RHOB|nr:hypothetical protein [Yoonia sediminilitoris]PUB10065.1 hypothetical protein C8N45_12217 [Yoonia sediminilitoris]RCW89661.1 hypothetical protein DFP92_12217 [Yoonia sediminilitoris]
MSEQHRSATFKETAKEQDLFVKAAYAQSEFQKLFADWRVTKADSQAVIAKGEELLDLQEQLNANGGGLSPSSVMHRVEVVKDAVRKGSVKPTQEAADLWAKRVEDARRINRVFGSKK